MKVFFTFSFVCIYCLEFILPYKTAAHALQVEKNGFVKSVSPSPQQIPAIVDLPHIIQIGQSEFFRNRIGIL